MSNEDKPTTEPLSPLDTVTAYLDERGFRYHVDPVQKRIHHTVWGRSTNYRVELRVTHEDTLFLAYIYIPIAVRDEKFRTSANELLTRANYGLSVGNFEFDTRDGEIRIKVSQAIGSFPLEKEVIGRLLRSALSSADRYFPALVQHLYAGITPEDAVYTAELDIHADNLRESTRLPSNGSEAPQSEGPSSRRTE
jgi:hypothetical protein